MRINPFLPSYLLKMTMKRYDAWSSGSHFAIVRVTKTIAEILPQNPDIVLPFILLYPELTTSKLLIM